MTKADFKIEIFSRVDDVSPDWPDADDTGGAALFVFQSKSFLAAWERSYATARNARLCLVEARDAQGAPLLFMPLSIQRRHGARVLAFMDDGVCDYNAPILFPAMEALAPEEAKKLIDAVLVRLPAFDLIHLVKTPERVEGRRNPIWDIAERTCKSSCHWMTLDRPAAEIEASIRGVRNFRKRARALTTMPGYRFFVAGTPEERAEVLEALLQQKQRRFEETQVPGFDAHPEKKRFFETVTEPLAARGALHLSAIAVDGQIVATMWSLARGGHYCAMLPSFENGPWSKYSPGKVILLKLIETLKAEGYRCLDLGFGDEPWKQEFADLTVPLRDHVAAHSLRGRSLILYKRLMDRLRATAPYRKLRPLKWMLLRKFSR